MARARYNFSADQIGSARELRASGMSWENIGFRLGCHENTIRERLDPDFAAGKRFRYTGPASFIRAAEGRLSKADEDRAFASIRPDTRTRQAKWMGDPLPGRSALDQITLSGFRAKQATVVVSPSIHTTHSDGNKTGLAEA